MAEIPREPLYVTLYYACPGTNTYLDSTIAPSESIKSIFILWVLNTG